VALYDYSQLVKSSFRRRQVTLPRLAPGAILHPVIVSAEHFNGMCVSRLSSANNGSNCPLYFSYNIILSPAVLTIGDNIYTNKYPAL